MPSTWKLVVLLCCGVVVFGFLGAFDPAADPNAVQAVFLTLCLGCVLGLFALAARAAYRSGRERRARD